MERDQLIDELNTFKGIANNQEANKTELQRNISRVENEKISMNQHIMELQQDNENLRSQITFEQARFKDLEQVVENERRGAHGNELKIQDLER